MADQTTSKTNMLAPDGLRAFLRGGANGNVVRLLVAVIVILVALSLLRPDTFLKVRNMQSMAFQSSEIGVLAIAIMITMLSGGIDLSIVSTANLSGIVAGLVLSAMIPADATGGQVALGLAAGIGAALMVGAICGAFNGLLVARFGFAPILATLGTLLAYKGLGTAITKGTTIFGVAQSQFIGNGLIARTVPVPLVILIGVVLIIALILGKTPFGLQLYMLGTNPTAARFSGINNRRVVWVSYVMSGMLASIAGIIILGRTNAANVDFGGPYVLLAILIAVLGNVDPYGGSGSVWGVLLALVGVQFLSTGVNMLLFQSSGANFFKEFAWGLLLLIVLVVNYFSHRAQNRGVMPAAEVLPETSR